MIPKKIHYCWFGGKPLPDLAIHCIKSWKEKCKDYEIIEWNDNNFDINIARYSEEAARLGKWAFVSDVVRFYVIYQYGGIYLDTDVEILRPFDDLLNVDFFIGFESLNKINSGQGFGAIDHFALVKKMLDIYKDLPFIYEDGTINNIPSPYYTSRFLNDAGFLLNNTMQLQNGMIVYPTDYFCPKEWWSGNISITKNTYSIHHFDASWWDEDTKKAHEFNIKKNKILQFYKSNNRI